MRKHTRPVKEFNRLRSNLFNRVRVVPIKQDRSRHIAPSTIDIRYPQHSRSRINGFPLDPERFKKKGHTDEKTLRWGPNADFAQVRQVDIGISSNNVANQGRVANIPPSHLGRRNIALRQRNPNQVGRMHRKTPPCPNQGTNPNKHRPAVDPRSVSRRFHKRGLWDERVCSVLRTIPLLFGPFLLHVCGAALACAGFCGQSPAVAARGSPP
jgi:hypothetical protein